MKTIHEFKARLLDTLAKAVIRPGMFGGNELGTELFFRNLLSDLVYIDERETELEIAWSSLEKSGLFLSTGVHGGLRYRIPIAVSLTDEIGSVYAAIAAHFGYLTLEREVSTSEYRKLFKGVRRKHKSLNTTSKQIVEIYGTPSLKIGRRFSAILCYAIKDGGPWIYFDCESAQRLPNGQLTYAKNEIDDPPLRNIRLPGKTFSRSVVFTPRSQERMLNLSLQRART